MDYWNGLITVKQTLSKLKYFLVVLTLIAASCGTTEQTVQPSPINLGFPTTEVIDLNTTSLISFQDIPLTENNVLWFWAPH